MIRNIHRSPFIPPVPASPWPRTKDAVGRFGVPPPLSGRMPPTEMGQNMLIRPHRRTIVAESRCTGLTVGPIQKAAREISAFCRIR